MSRLFSLSLISIMLMMSVLGPAQPIAVATNVDASTPVAQDSSETTSPDISAHESFELVEDENPDMDGSETAEPEGSVAEETQVMDALAEQQTPASDDIESRRAPGMIVPNAVDPNPGDCPVDEICDGGGGGGNAPQILAIPISAYGVNGTLTNATIEVFDSTNASLGAQVTGEDGFALFDLTVGETYTLVLSAPGYQSLTYFPYKVANGSMGFGGHLIPLPGSATFTVLDQASGVPIEFASVVFTDNPNGDYQAETDENGVISFADLEPGTYSFTVSNPGHAPQEITVTIAPGENYAITVELVASGSEWTLTIVNSVTGAPVGSASIWIEHVVTGDQVSGQTAPNGTWVSPRIADGDYIITVDHDDYVNIQNRTVAKTSAATELAMQPYQEGKIALTVVDLVTGQPIANAQVTIMYSLQPVVAVYGTTNAAGQWTSEVLPGGEHQLNVHADGYDFERETVTIASGVASYEVKLQPRDYGRFTFAVMDQETGNPVPGARVTVHLRGGVYLIGSGETDLDGIWIGPTTGWAEYQYTISRSGYKTVENMVYVQGTPFTRTVYLERGVAHDVEVSVTMPAPVTSSTLLVLPVAGVNVGTMPALYAQVSGDLVPVAGARISIIDPYSNDVLHTGTTGNDGTATISGVYEGNYRLVIAADGMETHTQAITVGEGTGVEITMFPAVIETPTDPEPGDGDGNNDGDGDDEDTDSGDPDTDSNPGTDGGSGAADPDTGSNPDTDGGSDAAEPDTGSNQGTDNTASEEAHAERAMAPSVDTLPNTGAGPVQSGVMLTAMMIATVLGVMCAAIRRLVR